MPGYVLTPRRKISSAQARKLIYAFAKHGNHVYSNDFRSNADVERAFARNGVDFARLVDRIRDFNNNVPFFENLIGSTMRTDSEGTRISRIDNVTGAEDMVVEGPGQLVLYGYWATFETFAESLKRAIENKSYSEMQSAIVNGIASIEAYISYRAERWNAENPGKPLVDSVSSKVSFDDKIDKWIPVMTGGRKLDKSGLEWRDYKVLRAIRDDVTIHPKKSGHAASLADLAKLAYQYKTGIAGILMALHKLFGDQVPRVIIRAAFAPEVELVKVEGTS
jgi:hypothetical protein